MQDRWRRQRIAFVVTSAVAAGLVMLWSSLVAETPQPTTEVVAAGVVAAPAATTASADQPSADVPTPSTTTPELPSEVTAAEDVLGPPVPADPAPEPSPAPTPGGPALPLRVRIPEIGVDAGIVDLGLKPDRTLQVPRDFSQTGWYTGRAVPGNAGPSVVVGHVDSTTGPAVFHRLRHLEVGDIVEVDRSDGLVARFEVSETFLIDKDEFPTEQVYGPTDGATLRLITCGGGFDEEASSYRGNLIVFAEHLGNFAPDQPDGMA